MDAAASMNAPQIIKTHVVATRSSVKSSPFSSVASEYAFRNVYCGSSSLPWARTVR